MPCERSLWQSNSATLSPPSSFHFTFKLKSEPEAESADTTLDCSAPARGLASNTAAPFPRPTRAEAEVSTRHEQLSGRVPAHVCTQHTAEVGHRVTSQPLSPGPSLCSVSRLVWHV